jgi:hypothetical protein
MLFSSFIFPYLLSYLGRLRLVLVIVDNEAFLFVKKGWQMSSFVIISFSYLNPGKFPLIFGGDEEVKELLVKFALE